MMMDTRRETDEEKQMKTNNVNVYCNAVLNLRDIVLIAILSSLCGVVAYTLAAIAWSTIVTF